MKLFTVFTDVSLVIIYQRSIAERGDVFSGVCLFVRVFVCLFGRRMTFERLNVGQSNLALAVRYIVQKSRPSSKVRGEGHQGQKRNTAESSPLTMRSTGRAP